MPTDTARETAETDPAPPADPGAERPLYRPGIVPGFYLTPAVHIAAVPAKGLGVRARTTIRRGEIVECCPMLVLSPAAFLDAAWRSLHKAMLETIFQDYLFAWTRGRCALALGYGGLYNHSEHPSADAIKHFRERKMTIVANQDIEAGREVTIRYNDVWFEPVD